MARASKADKDLLATLRDRHKRAVEADQENRRDALEDLRFAYEPGSQWDEAVKNERGTRPCLEFNRLRVTIKRVINDMRAQRPNGKVRPAEDADKQTAQAIEGLIRNIWANSDGDSVIDQAAEYQVASGMGAWRINTKYSRDDAWDQDLAVEAIPNPFCLFADPASKDPTGRDAEYWILTTRMSHDAYKARWPKAEVTSFESESDEWDDEDWSDEDSVRVCEYWYREPVEETLLLLSDGRSVKGGDLTAEQVQMLAAEGITPVKSRSVQCYQIKMVIASGDAILERADWVGSYFPFVRVYGDALIIDGSPKWWGLTRHAKDAQRAYNYSRTLAVETVALAPQAKFWATPEQAQGHTDKWAEAHKKNFPYLLYNADPRVGGPPARMGGADIPAAWIHEIELSGEDIKSTTGIFDASLGARTNETSGVAIRQRQLEGNLATWNFSENLARGIRRTWELLIDAIPKVYDTQRQIRVLGIDGAEKYLSVNDGVTDLSRGKYDVTVTVGPNFSTQRQESAEVYMALAQANPAIFPIAGDLLFKAMDLPYSDQIAERLKTLLPPQIQQMEAQGAPHDPQVMMAMAQVDQAASMVQEQGMLVQQAAAEADQKGAEVQKQISDLEVKRAQFEAQVAKVQAEFAKREAEMTVKAVQAEASGADEEVQVQVQAERTALAEQLALGIQVIQAQAQEFMQAAAQVVAEMQARNIVVADPPKNKRVVVERVNGKLVGTIVEEAAPGANPPQARQVVVERVGGKLVGNVTEVPA